MGCGRSKLNHGSEIVPRRIRLFIIRKFESIVKKRKVCPLKKQTPSRKKLLKDNVEKDDSCLSRSSVLVVPSSPIKGDGESEQTEWYDVMWDKESETETENERFVVEEEEMMEKVVFVVHEAITEMVLEDGKVTENSDPGMDSGSVEHDGRVMTSFDDSFLLPGSPSFRIYCVGVSDSDDEEGKDGEILAKEDDETSENTRIDDTLDARAKSENSHEENSCNETEKKTRRRKGFRRILLPTRKPVMHLFRVKSCYIPSCAGKANTGRTTG